MSLRNTRCYCAQYIRITIKPIKSSWDRKEVERLINKFNCEHSDQYSDQLREWFDKNL